MCGVGGVGGIEGAFRAGRADAPYGVLCVAADLVLARSVSARRQGASAHVVWVVSLVMSVVVVSLVEMMVAMVAMVGSLRITR